MSNIVAPALSDDILAAYCPVLHLHHHDAYRPVSVEWFIERAQLNYYNGGVTGAAELHELDQVPGGVVKLIPAGQVTQDKLLEAQASCPHPSNLSLTVGPEHYGGVNCDQLDEVPIYAHAKLVVDDYGAPEAYEINYITYYAFNGAYHLPANVPLFRTGHHVGDWEHLTVRLDAASLELQGVWYNAHRNIEGEWCPAEAVPRTPCGRIVGYVAINGHGIYPHCGTIPRLFFVANDRTSRRGPVWNPARLVRLCGLAHGSGCAVVPSRGCSLPCRPPQPGCLAPAVAALPTAAAAIAATAAATKPAATTAGGPAVKPSGRVERPGAGSDEQSECGGSAPAAQISADGALEPPPASAPDSIAMSPGRQTPVACCGGDCCDEAGAAPAASGSATAGGDASGAGVSVNVAEEAEGESECTPGKRSDVMARTSAGAQRSSDSPAPPAAPSAASAPVAAALAPAEAPLAPSPSPGRPVAPASASSSSCSSAAAARAVAVADPDTPTAATSAAAVAPSLGCGSEARPLGDTGGGEVNSGRPVDEGPHRERAPCGQYPLPKVVHDTSPWQRYRGFWGSVVSATEQGWFQGAEPPVSRGSLRRLFLPFARGVERLEPAKTATTSALRKLVARMVG
ncbi:hypothetical protein PLESTB_001251300 [Pleodorina starrii]|uniref:Uncharacterized protein n=1 Tax=Pleodorina starrii TaxID=330485 RepID=A0A9W6BT93_9CHLO|nr:hypothetical protein PLESTB_001251300 [Pleodorina starrii]